MISIYWIEELSLFLACSEDISALSCFRNISLPVWIFIAPGASENKVKALTKLESEIISLECLFNSDLIFIMNLKKFCIPYPLTHILNLPFTMILN